MDVRGELGAILKKVSGRGEDKVGLPEEPLFGPAYLMGSLTHGFEIIEAIVDSKLSVQSLNKVQCQRGWKPGPDNGALKMHGSGPTPQCHGHDQAVNHSRDSGVREWKH